MPAVVATAAESAKGLSAMRTMGLHGQGGGGSTGAAVMPGDVVA